MNKKGFTLIEILVTISIIAALATIAVVSVESVMKKSNNKISDFQKDLLAEAAKQCIIDEECVCNPFPCEVTSKDLYNNNYIEKEFDSIEKTCITNTNNKISATYGECNN